MARFAGMGGPTDDVIESLGGRSHLRLSSDLIPRLAGPLSALEAFQGMQEALSRVMDGIPGMTSPAIPATLEEALQEIQRLEAACDQLMSDNLALSNSSAEREQRLKDRLEEMSKASLAAGIQVSEAARTRGALREVLSLFISDGQWARSVTVSMEDLNGWRIRAGLTGFTTPGPDRH